MELYHATTQPLQIGEILCVDKFDGGTTHYYQNLDATQKELERLFDMKRPEEYCSRKKAIFLFDNPSYCFHYAQSQYKDKKVYVYKVEAADSLIGFPICLIKEAYKRYKSQNNFDSCITEYWNPQLQWNVKEYLASCAKVMEECQNTANAIFIASMQYNIDVESSEKLK